MNRQWSEPKRALRRLERFSDASTSTARRRTAAVHFGPRAGYLDLSGARSRVPDSARSELPSCSSRTFTSGLLVLRSSFNALSSPSDDHVSPERRDPFHSGARGHAGLRIRHFLQTLVARSICNASMEELANEAMLGLPQCSCEALDLRARRARSPFISVALPM